jgi:uncharacterized glyoxalase superfamily protein PhnB
VTDDIQRLAAFYARLVQAEVVLNDYYVEVPTATASVGFSRRHFTEYREDQAARPCSPQHQAEIMLDFRAGDVDAEYQRIAELGVAWVMPPATQPWGNRTMIFRDPGGTSSTSSHPATPSQVSQLGPSRQRSCPARRQRLKGQQLGQHPRVTGAGRRRVERQVDGPGTGAVP